VLVLPEFGPHDSLARTAPLPQRETPNGQLGSVGGKGPRGGSGTVSQSQVGEVVCEVPRAIGSGEGVESLSISIHDVGLWLVTRPSLTSYVVRSRICCCSSLLRTNTPLSLTIRIYHSNRGRWPMERMRMAPEWTSGSHEMRRRKQPRGARGDSYFPFVSFRLFLLLGGSSYPETCAQRIAEGVGSLLSEYTDRGPDTGSLCSRMDAVDLVLFHPRHQGTSHPTQ
jgi:hypothetical protein